MPPRSVNSGRDFMGGTNGKGDADRSPGWRHGYDHVNWGPGDDSGFTRRGGRMVKRYGPAAAIEAVPAPPADEPLNLPEATDNSNTVIPKEAIDRATVPVGATVMQEGIEFIFTQQLADLPLDRQLRVTREHIAWKKFQESSSEKDNGTWQSAYNELTDAEKLISNDMFTSQP
jgi:hypothetical protein